MRRKFGSLPFDRVETVRSAFVTSILVIAATGWLAGGRGHLRGGLLMAGGLDITLFGLWVVKHASQLAEYKQGKLSRVGVNITRERLARHNVDRGRSLFVVGGVVAALGIILIISPSFGR